MENGQNVSGFSWDVSLDDQNEDPKSSQDLMVRRMKNRERQRRYRARKRLESEGLPVPEEINRVINRKKKETDVIPFFSPPIEVPVTGFTPADFVARVRSQRDWKRDARRAHMVKEQNGRDSANEAPQFLSFGTKDQPSEGGCQSTGGPKLDNNQDGAASHARRNWKEEARNKKC